MWGTTLLLDLVACFLFFSFLLLCYLFSCFCFVLERDKRQKGWYNERAWGKQDAICGAYRKRLSRERKGKRGNKYKYCHADVILKRRKTLIVFFYFFTKFSMFLLFTLFFLTIYSNFCMDMRERERLNKSEEREICGACQFVVPVECIYRLSHDKVCLPSFRDANAKIMRLSWSEPEPCNVIYIIVLLVDCYCQIKKNYQDCIRASNFNIGLIITLLIL